MSRRLIFVLALLCALSASAFSQRKVSVHMTTESLQKGTVVRSEAEIFFRFPEGDMVLKEIYPDQNIYMSNPLGEVRLYNPKKNQVIVRANEIFTSRNQNLYYFLTSQTYDLGLQEHGFSLLKSEPEENWFVSWWQAPDHLRDQVNQIKLVHSDMMPVHADYLDRKGSSVMKVYFADYQPSGGSQIPSNITEIIYLSEGDSLIKRTRYTDIRWDADVDENRFNIVIPDDAEHIR